LPDPDASASREYRTDLDAADPDRYQFLSMEKVGKLNIFLENVKIPVLTKIQLKIMTHLNLIEKDKTLFTGNAVT
jgi:hypothetical protein